VHVGFTHATPSFLSRYNCTIVASAGYYSAIHAVALDVEDQSLQENFVREVIIPYN